MSSRPDRLELVADLSPLLHQLVVGLQAEEEAFRHHEIAGEPQIRIGGYRTLAKHNLVDPIRRDSDRLCKSCLRQPHRLQKFLPKNLAWMRIGQEFSGSRRSTSCACPSL